MMIVSTRLVGFYGLVDSCVTQAFILRRGWQRVSSATFSDADTLHANFCAYLALCLLGYKSPRQAAAEVAHLWGAHVPTTDGPDNEDEGPRTPRPVRWGAERRDAVHEHFGRSIERLRGLSEGHFLASTEHLDRLSRQTVKAWLPTTCAQCNRERTTGGRGAASRPSTFCTGCGARLCVKCFFPWHMDRNLSHDEVVSMTQRWNQPNDPTTAPAKRRRGPASAVPSSTAQQTSVREEKSSSSEGTVSEGE